MNRALTFLALVAVVFVTARYGCDFSLAQSLFLTGLTCVILAPAYLRPSRQREFQPFRVWLKPLYCNILLDAGVLTNEDEWVPLLAAQNDTRLTESVHDGLAFFVLAYDDPAHRHMIAWSGADWFSTDIEWDIVRLDLASLPTSTAYPSGCRRKGVPHRAKVGVREHAGIEIVLRIDSEWWKARWDGNQDRPKFAEHIDPFTGDVELTVAAIPFEELQHPYAWDPRGWRVSAKQWEEARRRFGWSVDYSPEYPMSRGWGISHRYAEVTHEPI